MARYQEDESDDDIDDNIFCLLELLFFTRRDEYKPPRIDNHDDTEDSQKGIEVAKYLAYNTNTCRKIWLESVTPTEPYTNTFLTWRAPIDSTHNPEGYTDKEKSEKRIEDDIFSLFDLLFIASGCRQSVECPYCHQEERE